MILWATEAIAEAMEMQGRTRAEVAEALGTSRPNVTQILSGSRDMTLRTLAALAQACGMRVDLKLEPLPQVAHAPEATGIDFDKLEVSRRRLGIEGDGERWPKQYDDPALSRLVLGLDDE
ncbi:MAG: helix-turn-helix transcriptional regulator [Gemmatimonadota bacterium]|uniref:helix-turn-helix domain-containing protein n=1 Tax=Candidatus Palauibacter scopulicola TaxID=3056741 RepID=UPI00238AA01F|nr:helix-turn-helix transcriptional regulator [Candidatus Palauibacter scopulicola]MDE2664307.1 helix-turn-helix transcriptional regulator [Candidatus Palauibacter scopulicola]